MPLLLLLSGLLLGRTIQKPPGRYLYGKWSRIVWPFIVWNLIRWGTRPELLPLWSRELWLEPGYLWYLLYISAYYILALPFRRVPPWIPVTAFVGAWLIVGDHSAFSAFVHNGAYFFAGYAVFRVTGGSFSPPHGRWRMTFLAIVAVGTSASCSAGAVPDGSILIVPAVASGILVVLRICEVQVSRGRLGWLEWVGRNSLILYVTHFPVMSGTSRFLGATDAVSDQWLWLPCLTAGIAVAVACVFMQRFRWARWPYRAPRAPRKI
jgi:fucose 4-O-acetylase-like acetyltransferase